MYIKIQGTWDAAKKEFKRPHVEHAQGGRQRALARAESLRADDGHRGGSRRTLDVDVAHKVYVFARDVHALLEGLADDVAEGLLVPAKGLRLDHLDKRHAKDFLIRDGARSAGGQRTRETRREANDDEEQMDLHQSLGSLRTESPSWTGG